MSGEDDKFWQQFRREVKPLRKAVRRKKPAAAAKAAPLKTSPAILPDRHNTQKKHPERVQVALTPAPRDGGWQLDRGMIKNLRVGRVPIEAKLDLHGMTQQQAHRALLAFIAAARTGGMRCVLVITGKGGGRDETGAPKGILKTQVPRWLKVGEAGQAIIGTETAAPRHGGTGALYVILKRTPRKQS